MNHQMSIHIWFLWLFLVATAAAYSPSNLLVCPKVGCMEGTFMPGYQTKRFEAYMGIPYAIPPIGELRFANPKLMPKWKGIYNATAAKADCIQKNYLLPTPIIYGDEDCLYLNVYRPERRPKQKLPVMVYIHGGGFFSGSAGPLVTGPEYLMDTGEVIVVTMAYRLGALGFLSTQDSSITGNFGLKDQNMALLWVQKNIDAFGGNPKRVTIFGQSAGGISTHFHMLSPKSSGLFQNAISMSGTANVNFAIEDEPLALTRKVAKLCNIQDAEKLTTAELVQALRKLDVYTLTNAGDGLKFWNVDHMTNYRPVVEAPSVDAFLTAHPKQLLATSRYPKVPWLIGTVPGEGAVRVVNIMENTTLRADFNSNFDELLQTLLEFPKNFSDQQLSEKMALIIAEYFQNQHEINDLTVFGFQDLISDRGFKQPLYNALNLYLRKVDTTKHPLYIYNFNYKGSQSYAQAYTANNVTHNYGVVHCDDLVYLFRSPLLFKDFPCNSTEAKVIEAFVGYLVFFAKTGKPKGAESLELCTEDVLVARPNGICDYHEFVNVESESFKVRVSQKFPVQRLKLWSNILEESILSKN